MRIVKLLNYYFFDIREGEVLHPSDAIWFYGGLSLFVIISISVLLLVG